MRFEWDPAKARSNQGNHHVSSTTPCSSSRTPTPCSSRTAPAQRGVALAGARPGWRGLTAAVVHTAREAGRDEVIRLISARRATRKSENRYEQIVYKTLSDSPITPARKRKLARLAARPMRRSIFRTSPHSNRASGKTRPQSVLSAPQAATTVRRTPMWWLGSASMGGLPDQAQPDAPGCHAEEYRQERLISGVGMKLDACLG